MISMNHKPAQLFVYTAAAVGMRGSQPGALTRLSCHACFPLEGKCEDEPRTF
jgi:hypothetical protein